jgi:hypothetical protein
LAERAVGFWIIVQEEERDASGKVTKPAVRHYYPPDVTAGIFFLKNRIRERWRDVYEKVEKHELKTSAELLIEIKKELAELQLPAPKKTNGR